MTRWMRFYQWQDLFLKTLINFATFQPWHDNIVVLLLLRRYWLHELPSESHRERKAIFSIATIGKWQWIFAYNGHVKQFDAFISYSAVYKNFSLVVDCWDCWNCKDCTFSIYSTALFLLYIQSMLEVRKWEKEKLAILAISAILAILAIFAIWLDAGIVAWFFDLVICL